MVVLLLVVIVLILLLGRKAVREAFGALFSFVTITVGGAIAIVLGFRLLDDATGNVLSNLSQGTVDQLVVCFVGLCILGPLVIGIIRAPLSPEAQQARADRRAYVEREKRRRANAKAALKVEREAARNPTPEPVETDVGRGFFTTNGIETRGKFN